MTEMQACRYRSCWRYVEKHVLPGRLELSENSYPGLRARWWQYWRRREDMYQKISGLDRVIAITVVSKTAVPVMVSAKQVFSNALVIFATDLPSDLAFLSSAMHFVWWTAIGEPALRTDPRYTPTDGFGKLPRPQLTTRVKDAGMELESFRKQLMRRESLGLTALYHLVNDQTAADGAIAHMPTFHVEIDEAVREAYAADEERNPEIQAFEARIASAPLPSWREIDLAHGFHDTPQGQRFTISPQARTDVLDKLLALNHYRHQQELASGVLNKKKSRSKPKLVPEDAPTLDDGTLFPPPDALF